ncbi:MAG: hypothetical protein RTU63_03785 [Candidatus Thorarchaeota archaeon]
MKLFYKLDPNQYPEKMKKIREEFGMTEDIDEEKTILSLNDDSRIERVIGSYDPSEDDKAQVRVYLEDESLRGFFDTLLGQPFRVK